MQSNKKWGMLEYRLVDVLEMNYSKHRKAIVPVLKKLLSRPVKDFNVYPFSAFAFEDALVVIQDGGQKKCPKEFYLLNAHTKSFQVYSLGDHSSNLPLQ